MLITLFVFLITQKKKLDKLRLKQKNDRVYYSKNESYKFSIKDIFELEKISPKKEKLIRICLHKNDKQKMTRDCQGPL